MRHFSHLVLALRSPVQQTGSLRLLGLAGPLLALAVLAGGMAGLRAQSPGSPIVPPGTAPPRNPGGPADLGPALGSRGASPGLSSPRPIVAGIQRQGDLLRFHRNIPGDAKPILVEADQISTWSEEGVLVLLLQGQVLVQQGVAHTRFEQGVAWVDTKNYKMTGIRHMDLYAEGQVRIDTSAENQDGGRAILDLNTHGEFRVRAHRGKVLRQDRSTDPLVARARALGLGARRSPSPGPVAPAPSVVVPTPRVGSAPPLSSAVPGSGVSAPAPAATVLPPLPAGSSVLPPVPGGSLLPTPAVPAPGSALPPSPSGPSGGIQQTSVSISPVQQTGSGSISPGQQTGSGNPSTSGVVQAQVIVPVPTSPSPPSPPLPGPTAPGPSVPIDPLPPKGPPPQNPLLPQDPPVPLPGPVPPANPGIDPNPPGPAPQPPSASRSNAEPGPGLPPPSKPAVPAPPPMPPSAVPRQYRVLPRSGDGAGFDVKDEASDDGRHIITVTGGVILNVRNVPGIGLLDVEADRAVVWTKGSDADKTATQLRSDQGTASSSLEFYMAGHVILRTQRIGSKESSVVRCDEVYYDTNRNVMVALNSRLELRTTRFLAKAPQFNEPVIIVSPELFRTSEVTYEFKNAEVFASRLPSDPDLIVYIAEGNVEDRKRPLTNLFGRPVVDPKTGRQAEITQSILEARRVTSELDGIPFFYTPYYKGDARDPLGPLETINAGYSNIFGAQIGVGLNVYKLLGLLPPDGLHWRLNVDYLSLRGPGFGSDLDYGGNLGEPGKPGSVDPFGLISLFGVSRTDPNDPDRPITSYVGMVRSYMIYDNDTDNLGGNRPNNDFEPPNLRGRFFWRNAIWDLPFGFTVQSQANYESDRNYFEQYYKNEFDTDADHTTFVYVKQQQDNWAWSALVQPRTRTWMTETQWLPRFDGYLLGQSFFDRITTNTQVSAAFAKLSTSNDPPQPVFGPDGLPTGITSTGVSPLTDVADDTGRLSIMEEVSYPLTLGAFKVVPYVKGLAAEYTNDLEGTSLGRLWGGGGVRASIPFTRLFPDVQSDLLNLDGINHKIVVSGNYFYADANTPYTKVPQLDRLNDSVTDEAMRDFKPQEALYNQPNGLSLALSRLYDPQTFAIRTLIDNRIDTLDHIDVFQFDLRQRWQTKRGYPGSEHIVDWMVLDTSFSWFPEPTKDNFGKPFAFLKYDWLWNVGDRTSLESSGWFDPEDGGPRVWTIGANFNRTDNTSFFLGYRQIDPLQSRAVTAAVTYIFSPKYALTFTTTYDFGAPGTGALNNSVLFTRTGSDLKVTLGLTYNALQNSVGAVVMIVPTLVPIQVGGFGPTGASAVPPQ